jgi:uncharacterized OB-fold protein
MSPLAARDWRPITFPESGRRCTRCGAIQFPARHTCRICRSRLLRPHAIIGRGVLHTQAIACGSPSGDARPILRAWIVLEEGLLVQGQLQDVQPEEAVVGLPVELLPQRDYRRVGGNPTVHFFRPVRWRPIISKRRPLSRQALRLVYSATE